MNKKHKIACVLTSVEYGGIESVCLSLLRSCNQQRYEIIPIVLARPEVSENDFVRTLNKYQIRYFTISLTIVRNKIEHGLAIVRCLYELYRIVRNNNFDLIHSNGALSDLLSIPVSKLLGIPCISTCHGFTISKSITQHRVGLFMLKFCSRIIAVSEEILKELVKSRIDESRIVVITNAIQAVSEGNNIEEQRLRKRKLFHIGLDELVIGYVGRLSAEKGLKDLIEAGALLKQKDSGIRVLIIGDGPEREELKRLTISRGLENEVIFTGFLHDIEEWLPVLDVFVLPSHTEGTPMALLEAMSMGLPIVATAVGGIPNIIQDGKNGLLVRPEDYKDLSEKISMLKNDLKLRNKLATEALNTIKIHYNVNDWVRKIENEYDALLDGRL